MDQSLQEIDREHQKIGESGQVSLPGLAGVESVMYYRRKVERKSIEVQLPPTWCSGMCKNSMNDVCIEECVLDRKAARFELKPGMTLEDLPKYPVNDANDMTKEEKFTSVVVYLSKVVDHLQGADGRKDIYPSRRRIVPKNIKKQGSLSSENKRDITNHDK